MNIPTILHRAAATLAIVIMSASGAWAESVKYIDAAGQEQTVDAIVINNDILTNGLGSGWYVVSDDVNTSDLCCYGNVHLILADGKTMEVNGFAAVTLNGGDLTIYGQALGTGTLTARGSDFGILYGSNSENLTVNGGIVNATGGNYMGIFVNNLTVNRGKVTATSSANGICVNSNVTINGGMVTANGDVGIQAGKDIILSGGNVTATGSTGIQATGDINLSGGTVTASNYDYNVKFATDYTDGSTTIDSGDFGDPNFLIDITLRPVVAYIDENGDPATAAAINLTGYETNLDEGWYVVSSNIFYGGTVTLNGDVTLILADGCTMNVGTSESRINGKGINRGAGVANLDIFGQSVGSGTLSVYTSGDYNYGIVTSDLTVNGGNVIANTTGSGAYAFFGNNGALTINGGSVTATTAAAHAITATRAIAIRDGSVTANASGSGSNGIFTTSTLTYTGGSVNATGTSSGINANDGDGTITLGWTNPTDRIYASSYSGTVTVADGKILTDGTAATYGMTGYSGTLSDAVKTAIAGKTLRPAAITSYAEADGTQHNDIVAIPLTGGGATTLDGGTYVVSGNITYTGMLEFDGNATIILADGATMNVGSDGGRIDGDGIDVWGALNIYGQTIGTGTLSVYVNGEGLHAIVATTALIINGGNITANANGNYAYAIFTDLDGTVTINGGTVIATATGPTDNDVMGIYCGYININGGNVEVSGTDFGIFAFHEITINGGNVEASSIDTFEGDGPITLGWTNPANRIYANSYSGTLAIASGKEFIDEDGNILTGTVTDLSTINGKTLSPCLVLNETDGVTPLTTWAGNTNVAACFTRSFTANVASTVCLPFAMTSITGGKVYEFRDVTYDANDGWVATMSDVTPDGNSVTSTTANTPYLFMPSSNGEVTFSGTAANDANSYTAGTSTSGDWTFHGTYSRLAYGTDLIGSVFGFAATDATTVDGNVQAGEFVKAMDGAGVPPFRCYLTYSGSNSALQARATTRSDANQLPDRITVRLIGKDGETEGIGTLLMDNGQWIIDNYYDLNGRRLDGKPSKKGLYINNGRKVVIK